MYIGYFVLFALLNDIVDSKNCTCETGKYYCGSQLRRMNYQNIVDDNHLYYCDTRRALYHASCGNAACVENLPQQQPYCACKPGQMYCGANLQLMNWNASIYLNDVLYQCNATNSTSVGKKCTGAFCKSFGVQSSSCVLNKEYCTPNYTYCGYELSEMMYKGAVANRLYKCITKQSADFVETCENGCIYGNDNSYCSRSNKVGIQKPLQRSAQAEPLQTWEISSPVSETDRIVADNALHDPTRYQGDLILSDSQKSMLVGKNAISDLRMRWPQGVIPYKIDSSISKAVVDLIKAAAYDLYEKTDGCIRWIERTTETKYVTFIKKTGCSSWLGMLNTTDGQELSLGTGCEYYGTVIHEMLHAVGFDHEQNRPDRDNYINIYLDNVAPVYQQFKNAADKRYNFDKTPGGRTWTGYDYASIMHYGEYSFALDRTKKTMEDKFKKFVLKEPYDKPGMTDSDVTEVKKFYEGVCTFSETCA